MEVLMSYNSRMRRQDEAQMMYKDMVGEQRNSTIDGGGEGNVPRSVVFNGQKGASLFSTM